MQNPNIFYAQSGGVTAVINATACGVIETARQYNMGKVYAGHNGIIGALCENLIDTSQESDAAIAHLRHMPGGVFGSCRYKLRNIDDDRAQYQRLLEVFKAHNIGYFFYNGGNDSQDTTLKISEMSSILGYPLTCIGIPKTIDNDLLVTDNCPGFGSAAKYVATSIREGAFDVASMAANSTQVFIMEVMGRDAGWIAAASGLACEQAGDAPHIILFPEVALDTPKFLTKVDNVIKQYGHCAIVVAEGLRNPRGKLISESTDIDAFGHHQLGGTGQIIASMISRNLSYKCHYAVCDYLQRSARHLASQTDLDQAYALGKAAIEYAKQQQDGVMLTIERQQTSTYQWKVSSTPLNRVANGVKSIPAGYINQEGYGITSTCRDYLLPLIQGEAYPPFINGLPDYRKNLQLQFVEKRLPLFTL